MSSIRESSNNLLKRPCERDGNCYTPDNGLKLSGSKAKIEADRASLYYKQSQEGTSKMTLHKSISVDEVMTRNSLLMSQK